MEQGHNNSQIITEKDFHEAFLSLIKELTSFVFRLVTNKEDTEDLVQDTYLKAYTKLYTFQGNSTLKTWVFSIAVNLCKNHLAGKKRWPENTQQLGAALHLRSEELFCRMKEVFYRQPSHNFEIREHINYCFNCISKTLLLSQQICLLLKEVYGFSLKEIMSITKLSEGKAKHALADGRKHMHRIFNNRCSLIKKTGTCHECTTIKGILNPEQEAHIKANEIKMAKQKDHPNKEYLLNLRIDIVKGIDPLNSTNSIFHTYLLKNNPKWVEIATNE
ncbi:RNA polymerase sigma factor [Xanthovirga aplysinae]|uniref:RNA polymerase sigma factor n=1 Tax=Xanthovirga aplysinae TaxID=2529853 RepID=UPI0012BBE7E1|nr:RNA polymerase sigma factor [Xanthovirga aplysinae]MTI31389.1 RNA polymerase sigma factor [Xanthovirga aplysinae]